MAIKSLHLWRLTEADGIQTTTALNDIDDCAWIGGYGADGQYHHCAEQELWKAFGWAESHGMKLEYGYLEIEVPDSIFKDSVE